MFSYEKCSGIFKEVADKYRKRGEETLVSKPMEFNGKNYRQIIYNKAFLGKIRENMVGIIIVTEDGEIVENPIIRREIAYLAYQFQNMFDDEHIRKLRRAIIPENDIIRQEQDLEQMLLALKKLKDYGIEGIDTVVSVLTRLPDSKRENSKAVEEYIGKIDEYNSKEDLVLTKEMIEDVKVSYRILLIKNFQRVRLVNKGRFNYDAVLTEARKRRRRLLNRLGGIDFYHGMQKLEDSMVHLKKMLSVYSKIVDMSEDEYIKYLKDMDKKNLSERLTLVR